MQRVEWFPRQRAWVVVFTLSLAILLVAGLLAGPAAAQEHDPTEPDRPLSSFDAYPGPSVSLDGIGFAVSAIDQLAGISRTHTAVLASRRGWPAGADQVVIAPGETFHAALAAASLAGATRAPLLLAAGDGLDGHTLAELERLDPDSVHLVGDLPGAVEQQVAGIDQVETIVGDNVHETSALVAQAAIDAGAAPSTLIVASATSFADALSASALAAGLRLPLVLIGPDGMAGWLGVVADQLGSSSTLVIGGQAVIPDAALSQVGGVTRLGGADRYETSLAVADHARAAGLDGPPVVASGATFADGLAGGVLAGISHRAPLLLTDPQLLTDQVATWLAADGADWVRIMGGTAAVDSLVACQLGQGNTRSWFCVESELNRMGYNTGPVDGQIDAQAVWMTYAYQKVNRLNVDGDFGEVEFTTLPQRNWVEPRRPDLEPDHVEIDLSRQLILVVRDSEVIHVTHVSSGKPSTPTVRGVFRVYEKRNYRQANHMYRPVFFHRGYAFHGYPSVPLYPASHGCARTYDGDMDFLWDFLHIGEQVATYH